MTDGTWKLSEKTVDELLALKFQIEGEVSEIKGQIEVAKAHLATTGEYTDPDWYRRAKTAQRVKIRQVQTIVLALRDAKTRQKQQNVAEAEARNAVFERTFMYVAKEMLDASTYAAIMQEAQHRRGDG